MTDFLHITIDGRGHQLDPDEIKFTQCGIDLSGNGDWELGPARGICWRCINAALVREENNILKEVLDAATNWAEDPNDGDTRAKLAKAVSDYWMWATYEGPDDDE